MIVLAEVCQGFLRGALAEICWRIVLLPGPVTKHLCDSAGQLQRASKDRGTTGRGANSALFTTATPAAAVTALRKFLCFHEIL